MRDSSASLAFAGHAAELGRFSLSGQVIGGITVADGAETIVRRVPLATISSVVRALSRRLARSYMGCWLIRESFPVSAIFSFGKRRRVRKVETSTATPPHIQHSSTEQPQQPRAGTPRDRTRDFCVLAAAIALSPEESNAESELTWEAQTQRFAVEYKSLGSPTQIAEGVRQMLGMAAGTGDTRPMLAAPFLRTRQIEELVATRISVVDLSGKFGIVVPKRWLVMRTRSKNLFPSSAPIKNVY